MSQRRACQVISQPRATQRYERILKNDEPVLVGRMIELTTQYGRYGYRRITALLQSEGLTLHIFTEEAREYYLIEDLFFDSNLVNQYG